MRGKSFIRLLTGTALAALMAFGSSAAFSKTNTYQNGKFTDVSEKSWYAEEVASAYELGFMNGVSDTLYSPDGKVTVAQGITMASRVHASYNGKQIEITSGEWYDMYVKYALANGIIKEGQFDSYTRPIQRYEMAVLFASSMPADYFKAKNDISSIPDIASYKPYCKDILMLYNAGVVLGSDEYGTFYPNNDIKRCEAAAIINRVAIPENRLSGSPKALPEAEFPLYFADDNGVVSTLSFGTYGWDVDARGGDRLATSKQLSVLDIRDDSRSALLRKFNLRTSGKLTLETTLQISNAADGFHVILSHEDGGKAALDLFTRGSKWYVLENGKETDTGKAVENGNLRIKAVTDLDAKKTTLSFDGKLVGEYALADSGVDGVNYLIFSSEKETTCSVTPDKTKLYTGYALNETFVSVPKGDYLPYTWTLDGASYTIDSSAFTSYDPYNLKISVESGKTALLKTSFSPISQKTAAEMKFLMRDYTDGLTFALTTGGADAVKIYTKGNAFYSADGIKLYEYDKNVWQTLKITVNTFNGKVDYFIDNRKMGSGTYTASKTFDGIKFTVPAVSKSLDVFTDDFLVYNMFDDEDDYVKAPKPVSSDGYEVGMEVCDIWRNGFQFGWDYTSAFEETHPYLGMFDEGSTEAADWENKWLSEAGVDFKLVCWYSGTSTDAQKTPRNSFGLNAYMNSKYSDTVKYAIMWENSGNLPKNAADFRKNFVPYWIEYYFKDKDRYYTVDNKALFTIYRSSTLTQVFGDNAAVKAELDYLREQVKALGYDDLIILTTSSTSAKYGNFADMGFDGVYSYNLGPSAFDAQYQKTGLKQQLDNANALGNDFAAVPTVCVGFNNMYLNDNTRYEDITVSDYKNVFDWLKTDYFASQKKNSWAANMVILSNWNEFGEGHYIMPANLNGFGYLNTIKNAFTAEKVADADISKGEVPTEQQKERFTSLYYQGKSRLRRDRRESDSSVGDTSSLTRAVGWDMDKDGSKWLTGAFGIDGLQCTDGILKGKSTGGDFALSTTVASLNSADAHFLHVRMKLSGCIVEKQDAQFYFLTNLSKTWDESKATNFEVTADGEFHDYYVDLSVIKAWQNTITNIRFDPISRGNCEFEITVIEIMSAPEKPLIYLIDKNTVLTTDFTNTFDESGNMIAAINPYSGFFDRLGIYYTWDKSQNKLCLYSSEHSAELTMGQKDAVSDTGKFTMTKAPVLRDGIPEIEIQSVLTALGYEYEKDASSLIIKLTASDVKTDEKKYRYEFNVPGYTEGWTGACLESFVAHEGVLDCVSKSNGRRHDPVLNSPDKLDIPASRYGKITVGIRYELTDDSTSANSTIFFRTATSSFSEVTCVTVNTPKKSTDGEIIEIEFDMRSCSLWQGKIQQIRFDPFEAAGNFSVDYIRVILTDPDADPDAFSFPTELAEADAENAKLYTIIGDGANVSVVEDPDNKENHVYYAKASVTGKSWTHLKFPFTFKPGATYTVEFDVKHLGDYNGKPYSNVLTAVNFFYNSANHTGITNQKNSIGEWVHVSGTLSVNADYVPSPDDYLSIWCNPSPETELGCSFYVDNLKVALAAASDSAELAHSTKAIVENIDDNADGTSTPLYASGGTMSITEDPKDKGNKVYKMTVPGARIWNYIQANMKFTAGKTYKYSYDIYFLEDGNGESVSKANTCTNFCFGEDGITAKNHAVTDYAKRGASNDGWHHVEGSFTIPQNYIPSEKDYFGIYTDPSNNIGVCYLIDNIKLS